MADWQQRVVDERDALYEKITKLRNFVWAQNAGALPDSEQDRLWRQLRAMVDYQRVLQERIEAWVP